MTGRAGLFQLHDTLCEQTQTQTDAERKHISVCAITADGGLSWSLQGRAFI